MASLFDSERMQVRFLPPQLGDEGRLGRGGRQGGIVKQTDKVLIPSPQSPITNPQLCSCGGIGRRDRLKICFFVGSSPTRSISRRQGRIGDWGLAVI